MSHHLCTIVTPVVLEFWQQELSSHPDKLSVDRILKGLAKGFRIGYRGEEHQLRSAQSNMPSEAQHPQIISDYITKELSTYRLAVAGSPQIAAHLGIHVSPLGVIPKKGKDNQWRLIMDLSSLQGHSINNGIQKELIHFPLHIDICCSHPTPQGRKGSISSKNGH